MNKEAENTLTLRVVIPSGHRLVVAPGLPPGPDLPPGSYFVRIAVYAEGVYIKPTWFKIEWKADYSKQPCAIKRVKEPVSAQ